MVWGAVWLGLGAPGCEAERPPADETRAPGPQAAVISAEPTPKAAPPEREHPCSTWLEHYSGGQLEGKVCADDVARLGLTAIDLSRDWVPRTFRGGDGGPPPRYASSLVALADERFGDGPEWDRARRDRYFELYGIFPTLRVIQARLLDEARHACRDAVADDALEELRWPTDPWRPLSRQRADRQHVTALHRQLEAERQRRKVDRIEDLGEDSRWALVLEQYRRLSTTSDAILAMQQHLECEGLLASRAERRVFGPETIDALHTFQRREMLVGWRLDEQTAGALVADSRENDFRALLRALRERVVDATGLIEDGTAAGQRGWVAGRFLDPEAFRPAFAEAPKHAAPDRVSQATDAAAAALGLTDPASAVAFLARYDLEAPLRVAVALPPLPAYHGPQMELRAEIDRGEFSYDFPWTDRGAPLPSKAGRRPSLTLYAKDGERDVALVRWGTTIGGWNAEKTGRRDIEMLYKESPAGARVWRDVIATPVWVPPESTPNRDLLRPRPDGSWALKDDLFGPSYASAYGLVMMVHHRPGVGGRFYDEGIRTHGSVRYESIMEGASHGCHRLHNFNAVRLSGFLLQHRTHRVTGPIPLGYGRTVEYRGKELTMSFEDRGYKYELDPPVPVEVLAGRPAGEVTSLPSKPKSLPKHLADRFKMEMMEP